MFKSIHHISHLVWDIKSVEAYFEKNFGLRPAEREDPPSPKPRSIAYKIGPTVYRFSEPGHEHMMEFEHVRRMGGPVISHIGVVVDDIEQCAKDLKAAGVDFTQPEPIISPHGGYMVIDIAPEGSCGMRAQNDRWKVGKDVPENHFGIRLQLCEDLKK